MAFKRRSGAERVPDDPEQLYRLLALTNSGPDAVWGHQSDVLRSWHGDYPDDPDVAIELPTGAGKTLVGGLIGEYQRRRFGERVAYVCPTRQLARQTSAKLDDYGIPNVLLVNKVSSWSPADRARYNSADAIAVSVYSHVFNSNPALNNADMLVLDDAHAAEGYVASPWSLDISRDHEESAYLDVLSALAPALDPLVVRRLQTPRADGQYQATVHLASPIGVAAHMAKLEEVLAAAAATQKIHRSGRETWKFVQGHLDRCLVYFSHRRILIRPLIAPTFQHAPFSDPARRIYMSATLGAGGELERSFGRRAIKRIPIPRGWEKQGTGRRFFLFPELTTDLSKSEEHLAPYVAGIVAKTGRAVVLTPDGRTADKVTELALPKHHRVLHAADVEDDLNAFTAQSSAALVLNNRYDGIDLPDDDCRLVVLAGLPARGDLQERFLHESLGAVEVLHERIRARIMQGSGRATRNTRDFAAVLVLGSDLSSYLSGRDVQAAMHPEIHAELEFGLAHSLESTSAEMLENLDAFLEHGAEWTEVDADIVAARETYERVDAPSSHELQRAVRAEVAAWEAIWAGEWTWALDNIRNVLDRLRGARTPTRYAALWNYLAFSIAHRLSEQNQDAALKAAADTYYLTARRNSQGTTWLSHLAAPSEKSSAPQLPDLEDVDVAAMQAVLGATDLAAPQVFSDAVLKTRAGLQGTEYTAYEAGLVQLGTFAGAQPSYGNNDDDTAAAPDAVWIFGDAQWVIWEAKSEASPTGQVGADNARQAGAHLRFTATERSAPAPSDSVCLLVTPKSRVHPSARALAEPHVYLVHPNDALTLFDKIIRAWNAARAIDLANLSVPELATLFRAEGALPTQWLPTLRTQPLQQRTP
ncbi:DEAD/DEAH box helicase [Streptomyces sp. NPDC054855]